MDLMTRALEDHCRQLMHLRKCSEPEAWEAMAITYAENARLEADTSGEGYWKAALRIADERRIRALPSGAS
jgi:hypothetical protein